MLPGSFFEPFITGDIMSTLNDAFWHAGQRQIVGTMPLGRFTLSINGSEQLQWVATNFMINGTIGSLTVAESAASTTVINTTNFATGLHANNPVKTIQDDSQSSERTVRQNFLGLSVADGSHVYCIVTCSGAPTNLATTKAALHFYAGEVVVNTATARRPELDLSAECPLAQIYYNNTSGGALTVAAGTSAEYMNGTTAGGITDIGMIAAT